jgi:polysaccharide pyruvyl transferase CsaB
MNHKKVLIAGAYGTGNLGDEAILVGLLKLLVNNRNYDKNHMIVFSRDPDETRSLHNITARRKNLLDLLVANDIIIGGGELFQDVGYMAVKYSILGLTSKIIGKRVAFYAVGVSSNRSRMARFLMQISLSLADEICVRDFASKKRLRSLGIRKPIMIVADPASYVEPVSSEEACRLLKAEAIEVDKKNILVGIVSQYIRDPKLNEQTQRFFLSFLKNILKKHDLQVIFIPFSSNKDVSLDRDVIYGKWLEKNLKNSRFKVIHNIYTPQQVMGIFKLLDLVVSTRFHPLLFASKAKVPAIGVSIFEKLDSFCKKHNLPIVKINGPERASQLVDTLVYSALRKRKNQMKLENSET